jgi:hypothetical protein
MLVDPRIELGVEAVEELDQFGWGGGVARSVNPAMSANRTEASSYL